MTSIGHIIAAKTGSKNVIERLDLKGISIKKGANGSFQPANYDTLMDGIAASGLGNSDGKISSREFDARIQQLANQQGEVTVKLPNGREYTVNAERSTRGGNSGVSSSGLGSDSVSLSSPEAPAQPTPQSREVTPGGQRPVSAPPPSTGGGSAATGTTSTGGREYSYRDYSANTAQTYGSQPVRPYNYQQQINTPTPEPVKPQGMTLLQSWGVVPLSNGSRWSSRFGMAIRPPK
jgi:hypothetical protein